MSDISSKMSDDEDFQYQVIPLQNVMEYFVAGFTPKGREVKDFEFYLDTQKQVVVFRLYLRNKG